MLKPDTLFHRPEAPQTAATLAFFDALAATFDVADGADPAQAERNVVCFAVPMIVAARYERSLEDADQCVGDAVVDVAAGLAMLFAARADKDTPEAILEVFSEAFRQQHAISLAEVAARRSARSAA